MEDLNIYKNRYGDGYHSIEIVTDDGIFEIYFMGNLDLYWSYRPKESLLNCSDEKCFNVTKENYYLYSCIDELYNAIIKNMPYSNIDIDFDSKYKVLPIYMSSTRLGLVVGDEIKWYSDDFYIDEASSLSIKRDNDSFIVKFTKSKIKDLSLTFSVRFRNNGSRYDPFNFTFMNMYNKLLKYDYQVHMEEILFKQSKLSK